MCSAFSLVVSYLVPDEELCELHSHWLFPIRSQTKNSVNCVLIVRCFCVLHSHWLFPIRPQMKNSVNCILIGLASFDIVLITTSILMFGVPSIYTYSIVMG